MPICPPQTSTECYDIETKEWTQEINIRTDADYEELAILYYLIGDVFPGHW